MRASTLLHLALAAAALVAVGCSKGGNGDAPDAAPPDGNGNPQCSDGVDNDGDGKIDFPNDPGCLNANQDSETDDCPSGPSCPECANGKDDDGDGKIDYPDDPDCTSAADTTEKGVNAGACGADVPVVPMPTSNVAMGQVNLGASHLIGACGGLGPEVAYQIDVTSPIVLAATTDVTATGVDTVLYLRGATCKDSASELACNDNASSTTTASTLQAALPPGTYYLIVDAASSSATGSYELHVTTYPGTGQACDPQHACAPGYYCRPAPGATATTCQPPRCSDGVDDDGDQKIDFPNDPGCASVYDDDEADDCPSGPNCPACGNGKDDDKDGKTDFPADPDCTSASQPTESCGTERDPLVVLATATVMGDTSALHDDWTLACTADSSGNDAVYLVQLPHLDTLTISTAGSSFDTVLGFADQSCGAMLGCNDEDSTQTGSSEIDLADVAAGNYSIIVDGYGVSGAYTLAVTGTITPGARCDVPLFAAGALVCAGGTTCDGAICKGTNACDDGVDNDGDLKADYPADPGCTSPTDDDETDDCPSGPNCPACANGKDDDHDGQIDWPADTACRSASGTSESCASSEAPVVLASGTTAGDTTGKADDFAPSCASSTGGADVVYQLDVPALTALHADVATTGGWVADLLLLDGSCGGAGLACSSAPIDAGALAKGRYFLVVDGDSSSDAGAFTLHVSGSIAAGQSCESALAKAGALVCEAGYACKGATGSRTCQKAACNDGVDNDGDGKKDYPHDPGCTSPSDDDEKDDCPNGPSCPVCSNGKDDDGDGKIDYPADTACTSAAGTSESCASLDPILVATMPNTVGQIASTLHDDFDGSTCVSTGGKDQVYQVDLPKMATVTFDASVENFSDALEVYDPSCGAPALDCQYAPAKSTLTNLAAGRYFVVVDGYDDTSLGTFLLQISGSIAKGGSCEGALASSSAITCATGTTCKGTMGSRTCQ